MRDPVEMAERVRPTTYPRSRFVSEPALDPDVQQLKARLHLTVQLEQDLDLLAYFASLSEDERDQYQRVNLGHMFEEWERPVLFLFQIMSDYMDPSPLPPRAKAVGQGFVCVDEVMLAVRFRTGSSDVQPDLSWTPEDFATLRANVAWLHEWHTQRETE